MASDFGGGYVRDDAQIQQVMSSMTALGRTARAEDIGPAVAALLRPGTAWITGQRIEVSGGFWL